MSDSALLITLLAALGVPLLLVFAAVKFIRSGIRWVRWLTFIPIAVLTYLSLQVYWALYPREEFYRAEWLQQTGFSLPDKVAFRSKSATYPDQHGDYWAGAVVEVAPSQMEEIERQLSEKWSIEPDTSTHRIGVNPHFPELVQEIGITPKDDVYRCDSTAWFRVAILKERGLVIFERYSS